MKDSILNYFKNYVLNHSFKIDQNDNKLIFQLKNNFPFINKKLMLKHRITGKRILKDFKGSKVNLETADFNEIGEEGMYDIYIQMYFLNRYFLLRTNFNMQNSSVILLDKENKFRISSIHTNYSNLSFYYEPSTFVAKLTDFKIEDDIFSIIGEIQTFKSIDFDAVELAINFENLEIEYFTGNYEIINNKIKFHFDIDFEVNEKMIVDYVSLEVRLKKDEIILDSSKIKCHDINNINEKFLGYINNFSENNDLVTLFYFNNAFYLTCKIINQKDFIRLIKNDERLFEYNTSRSTKNLAFFESFHGKSYSGQPKYIYEKMLELGYDKYFDFIWSYDGYLDIPGNPLITSRSSDQFNDLLKISTHWITNISFPILKENEDIVYLQTTHGTPYKHMGADIETVSENVQRGRVLLESDTWNYLLSPNDFSKKVFKRAFEYDGEIINKGYPANDLFYQENQEFVNELKKKFNIASDKKIILYAPTFRDYHVNINKEQQFDLLLDLKKLYDNFHDEYIVVVRLHYLLSKNLKLSEELNDFVIDLSSYDDVAELYLISDLLITDYSSVFFDFAHTKRPILFFVPDFEEYSSFRGLYSEVKENLPGPEIYSNDELVENIKNIHEIESEFKEKYDKFYENYCNLGHGTASEDVVKIVFGDVKNE